MRHHTYASLFAFTLLTAGLTGCGSDDNPVTGGGGGGGGTTTATATVTPSLGKVFNAGIEARCMPTGVVMGSGDTGATGSIAIALTGACSGPVIVELVPNGSSTYFDEALGNTVALPIGTTLRAIVPSFTGSSLAVAVTPLTEIATQQALAAAGNIETAVTTAQATTANSNVVTQVLGAGVTLDILTPPTGWDASTAAGSLGTSEADRYAYYLASLARMGGTTGTPAVAVTETLANDLADGTLSGGTSGAFTYTSGDFTTQLESAINAMASYANTELQSAVGVIAANITGFSPDNGAVDSTVTITGAGFDSDLFHMVVTFSNGVAAEIVSSSATEIVVKVPAGAVNGPITVTNTISNTTSTSTGSFTVTGGGSTPGIWTARTTPSSYVLYSIAYGSGLFVTGGYNRTILTSTDGVSWTARTAPDSNFYQINSITHDGSQFVLVGDSSSYTTIAPVIATSADGVTWTRRNWTNSGSETQLVDIAASGSRLTAVGLNGTIITSTDSGATWSSETLPSLPAGYISALNGVAGNSTTRIAVGKDSASKGVIIINSGSGWTTAATALADFIPRDVIWTGTQFVAVGASSVNYGANSVVMTSPDGSTWTNQTIPTTAAPSGYNLSDIVWNGSKLLAVGGNDGSSRLIISSADGITWIQEHLATLTGQIALSGVAASSSLVIAVGGTRAVTSP